MGYLGEFNVIAILVAAIIGYVLGVIWYRPQIFGKVWMKEMKYSKKQIEERKKSNASEEQVSAFIISVTIAFVINALIVMTGSYALFYQITLGIILWIGFVATSHMHLVIWEKRSYTLFAIACGYMLINILLMVLVFHLWY